MTVASTSRAPASFEIKSATLPLVALLLKSPDLGLLAEELRERFGEVPDFFDHDPLVIDLGPLDAQAQLDFPQLLETLRPYRVVPVAVKGGSDALMQAARAAGLAAAPEASAAVAPAALPPKDREEPQEAAVQPPASALVVDRPLRSGQQVYARGRDLVLLAMVNPGAEVIADGHIHVYAPLRGKAIAGARGDAQARILTLSLEAELVSIAGVYRTSENPLPPHLRGKPAQVRLALEGDSTRLVMDPLNP